MTARRSPATSVTSARATEEFDRDVVTGSERVAVVGTGGGSVALGLSLAARLVRRCRVSAGLVLVRGETSCHVGAEGWRPAAPRARRRALGLAAAGFETAVTGRLVVVQLLGDPEEAASLAASLIAHEDEVVVTVLAGPRESEFDPLLAGQQRVVVAVAAEGPDALATLAVEQIALLAPAATVDVAIMGRATWRPLARRAEAARLLGASGAG